MTGAIAERNREEIANTRTGEPLRNKRVFAPLADIYETKDRLLVLADMPGVDNQSIDITIEKNVLTIQGFTSPQQKEEGLRLVHSECPEGNYRRVFLLTEEVDREGIEATVKNGVLTLVLPKSAKSMARKITVKSE